ncbi:hypothetical protein GCM10009759_52570 [Kitasatospora saccharophila]|uniref:Uncharacterized protein n=1 Tax=Kitasatospora saccharophila TaxID=407973 RepID=A0ABN2XFU2_9ACTN
MQVGGADRGGARPVEDGEREAAAAGGVGEAGGDDRAQLVLGVRGGGAEVAPDLLVPAAGGEQGGDVGGLERFEPHPAALQDDGCRRGRHGRDVTGGRWTALTACQYGAAACAA